MIQITDDISIDEREIEIQFIQAAGPGGQNVNKVATAVQLRFDVAGSSGLPADVRQRLVRLAGRRVSYQGILTIEARQYRTQEQNRQAALERLAHLIRQAAVPPKLRYETQPSQASKRRRLDSKRRRGQIKALRRRVLDDE